MKYASKERIESKTCPGVAFTVRRLTGDRRVELSLKLADAYDKLGDLRREAARVAVKVKPLVDQAHAAIKAGDADALKALNGNSDVIEAARLHLRITSVERDEILPVCVRALLHSVEGLEIDGKPATPQATVEDGPPELYNEIAQVVQRELGLSEDEQGNSASPTTSAALVDRRTNPTSAENAEGWANGGGATAEGSPST